MRLRPPGFGKVNGGLNGDGEVWRGLRRDGGCMLRSFGMEWGCSIYKHASILLPRQSKCLAAANHSLPKSDILS